MSKIFAYFEMEHFIINGQLTNTLNFSNTILVAFIGLKICIKNSIDIFGSIAFP